MPGVKQNREQRSGGRKGQGSKDSTTPKVFSSAGKSSFRTAPPPSARDITASSHQSTTINKEKAGFRSVKERLNRQSSRSSSSASSSATIQPTRKNKLVSYDVYEAADDEIEARKIMSHRNASGKAKLDDVETYEYTLGEDGIASEDDEEIDEDAAFGESDEERFGHYFQPKEPKALASRDIDLNEEMDLEDEESQSDSSDDMHDSDFDPEEMIQISDMLQDDEVEEVSSIPALKSRAPISLLLPKEDEDDEYPADFSSEDDEDMLGDQENDDDIEFIHNLNGKPIHAHAGGNKRRKDLLVTEAFPESEFGLAAGRSTNMKTSAHLHDAGGKVNLDTMLGVLGEETNLGGVKKQLESISKNQADLTVEAPLPPRIQNRYDRIAAYDEAKKEVSKWVPIVKKNREADHLLFPLNAAPVQNVSNSALVTKFEPKTDMEKEIQDLLESSQLTEKSLQEMEELELNQISKEELVARRAELAKLRSLMFHHEQKQKKIAKIKSKAYRKLHKKRKVDSDGSITAESALDAASAQAEKDKREFERAQERMTLKHKNTGKWAKHILGRGHGADDHSRKALMEQLNKHEELKRKIAGDRNSEENDSSSDDEGGKTKENIFAEFEDLERELDNEDAGKMDGVFGMKFMQRAAQKAKAENRQLLLEAKEELRKFEEGEEDSDSDEAKAQPEAPIKGKVVGTNQGRMTFGGDQHLTNLEAADLDHTSLHRAKPSSSFNAISDGPVSVRNVAPLFEVEPFNAPEDEVTVLLNVNHTDITPCQIELTHDKPKSTESPAAVAIASSSSQPKKRKAKSEISEAGELPEHELVHEKDISSLSQRELLSMAFANDNVELEFEEEKAKIMDRDVPKEEDLTLPGWGSWGGAGCVPKERVVVKKPAPGSGVEKSKRQDAKLKHVIINEKRAKKSVKYMAPQVPHGFDSRDQFERMMQLPLGKEWNAQNAHKDLTRPRVRTKLGQIIHPIKFQK